MSYVVQPIEGDRSWIGTKGRRPSQFKVDWPTIENSLLYEIEALKGRDVVLQLDVLPKDLRLNGTLRANARPSSGAIVVAFETPKHGQLVYRCDRFTSPWADAGPSWQHNARAIALTLEALRAVDRWGSTNGAQYVGSKAIGSGPATALGSGLSMSPAEAIDTLVGYADWAGWPVDPSEQRNLIRDARQITHPDRNGGSRFAWDEVETAIDVLRRHGRLPS